MIRRLRSWWRFRPRRRDPSWVTDTDRALARWFHENRR